MQLHHTGPPGRFERQAVGVVGTGYVGLTVGACLAHLGHRVVCVDVDREKVDSLRAGIVPIVEEGLPELVAAGLEGGHLRFEVSRPGILAQCDTIMLCLPTPVLADDGLDLAFVEHAVLAMRSELKPGALVATKSTVPIGTFDAVERWLDRPDVLVASNPEFLREGTAVADFLHPDRVIIGAADLRAVDRLVALYGDVHAPVVTTDPTSAELIKYAANSFLAAKISFINDVARLCESVGADIDSVRQGLGGDPRIGSAFLAPGPGWGGSCFPKDTRGLLHSARSAGVYMPIVEAAVESNGRQLGHVVSSATQLLGGSVAGACIAVWGASFKAGTDDCRDSPAITVMRELIRGGAHVRCYDPQANLDLAGATCADDPYSACVDADLLVVLTEWPHFHDVDMDRVSSLLAQPDVYDTRGVIDLHAATGAGLSVHRVGSASRHAPTTAAQPSTRELIPGAG